MGPRPVGGQLRRRRLDRRPRDRHTLGPPCRSPTPDRSAPAATARAPSGRTGCAGAAGAWHGSSARTRTSSPPSRCTAGSTPATPARFSARTPPLSPRGPMHGWLDARDAVALPWEEWERQARARGLPLADLLGG